MNKVTLVIVFLLMLAGCAKEQDLTQKSDSAALVQEAKQIEPAQPTLPAKAAEILKQEAEVEESGFQVAPPVTIVQEMQAKIKDAQQQKAPVELIKGADGIIAENRWGFSVYDPQTGITQYYTSNGSFLGQRGSTN
jgi:uncharacterized protein YcfL